MYEHPSNLDWYMKSKFAKGLSFSAFTKSVLSIPDYLSDRHFRSQTFYLSAEVKRNLSGLKTFTLNQFMNNESGELKAEQLNVSHSKIPSDLEAELLSNQDFLKRFQQDFVLFDSMAK